MGFWNFTIGQRRGIGIAAKNPLYVIEIRPEDNVIVVGESTRVRARTTFPKLARERNRVRKKTDTETRPRLTKKSRTRMPMP